MPVVANSQPEKPLPAGNLDFNVMRARVAEGIAERLAGDAVNMIPHDRVQLDEIRDGKNPLTRAAGVRAAFSRGINLSILGMLTTVRIAVYSTSVEFYFGVMCC